MKKNSFTCSCCGNYTIPVYEVLKIEGRKYAVYDCPCCDTEEFVEVWKISS